MSNTKHKQTVNIEENRTKIIFPNKSRHVANVISTLKENTIQEQKQSNDFVAEV